MVATVSSPTQEPPRIVLDNVPWDLYERLVEATGTRRVFMTYNEGRLELMSPSPRHEKVGLLLARFIHIFTEVRQIEILSLGMTTWKRLELDKGLEADQCFYVQNEAKLRHQDEIDLAIDPPPDLAIEVDLSSSSVGKEGIYAALRVPELWRYESGQLNMTVLDGGRYVPITASRAFPELTPSELDRFIDLRNLHGETAVMRHFRAWAESLTK